MIMMNTKMPAKGLLDSTVEKFSKALKFDEREVTVKPKRPAYYKPLNFYGTLERWQRICEKRGFKVKRVSPAHVATPHYHALSNGKPVAHYNTFLNAGHI
jgi:hypothetical protein